MKTHVIDCKTFVEVERPAKVGEKVIVVESELLLGEDHYGNIYTTTKIEGNLIDTDGRWNDGSALNLDHHEYRVLVPQEEAPESTDDIIANLVRRVASLERRLESAESQLRDTQNNVERQGVEIAEVTHLAKSNEADIRTLDERTQPKLTPAEDKALDAFAEALAKELNKRDVRR